MDLPLKYNWTCKFPEAPGMIPLKMIRASDRFIDRLLAESCDAEKLTQQFVQCKGFLHLLDKPASENETNSKSFTCRYALFFLARRNGHLQLHFPFIRYFQYYTACMTQQFTETCGKTPKMLSMPELTQLGEKYRIYEDTCKEDIFDGKMLVHYCIHIQTCLDLFKKKNFFSSNLHETRCRQTVARM